MAGQMRMRVVKTVLCLVLGENIPDRLKVWCIHTYSLEGLTTKH